MHLGILPILLPSGGGVYQYSLAMLRALETMGGHERTLLEWFGTAAGAGRVLDAGSALNHRFLLEHPLLRDKKLHIVTLAPEVNCYWQEGIGYMYEDLRALPIQDGVYETVVCLSTLEHVGCDNTLYGAERASGRFGAGELATVMGELRRILKPGGHLLWTVPFGAYEDHGTFQQFDLARVRQAIAAFGPTCDVSSVFYRYGVDGWNVAKAAECDGCRYVAWSHRPRGEWPVPMPVEPDRAAAARAVACVRLVKA